MRQCKGPIGAFITSATNRWPSVTIDKGSLLGAFFVEIDANPCDLRVVTCGWRQQIRRRKIVLVSSPIEGILLTYTA